MNKSLGRIEFNKNYYLLELGVHSASIAFLYTFSITMSN